MKINVVFNKYIKDYNYEKVIKSNHQIKFGKPLTKSKVIIKDILIKLSYALLPFLLFIIIQQLSWTGNMMLNRPAVLYPEIWLDEHIPLISEFVWVYYLTFPLAIFVFFWVAYKDKKHFWNLWLTICITFFISGIIYFFWQSEMIKPELNPVTLSDKFLIFTWNTCSPINCFPSQHCLMAFSVMLGVFNQKKTTKPWFWWFCMITGVLIVLATVFLKQHYVLDGVASAILTFGTYLIVKLCKFGDYASVKFGKKKKIYSEN